METNELLEMGKKLEVNISKALNLRISVFESGLIFCAIPIIGGQDDGYERLEELQVEQFINHPNLLIEIANFYKKINEK